MAAPGQAEDILVPSELFWLAPSCDRPPVRTVPMHARTFKLWHIVLAVAASWVVAACPVLAAASTNEVYFTARSQAVSAPLVGHTALITGLVLQRTGDVSTQLDVKFRVLPGAARTMPGWATSAFAVTPTTGTVAFLAGSSSVTIPGVTVIVASSVNTTVLVLLDSAGQAGTIRPQDSRAVVHLIPGTDVRACPSIPLVKQGRFVCPTGVFSRSDCFLSCNSTFGKAWGRTSPMNTSLLPDYGCEDAGDLCEQYVSMQSTPSTLVVFVYAHAPKSTLGSAAISPAMWAAQTRHTVAAAMATALTDLSDGALSFTASAIFVDRFVSTESAHPDDSSAAQETCADDAEVCSMAVVRALMPATGAPKAIAALQQVDMSKLTLRLTSIAAEITGAAIEWTVTSSARVRTTPEESVDPFDIVVIVFAPIAVVVAIIGCRVLHNRWTANDRRVFPGSGAKEGRKVPSSELRSVAPMPVATEPALAGAEPQKWTSPATRPVPPARLQAVGSESVSGPGPEFAEPPTPVGGRHRLAPLTAADGDTPGLSMLRPIAGSEGTLPKAAAPLTEDGSSLRSASARTL